MVSMGAEMREDIASILSGMIQTPPNIDLREMLSGPHLSEANFVRSALLFFTDPDEEDDEMLPIDLSDRLNTEYLRGIMMGLILAIDIESACGESLGRYSHGEMLELFDSAHAFLIENVGS